MSSAAYLDVSIIDELPPEEKPIKTLHFNEMKRTEMEMLMHRELAIGRQAFVVFLNRRAGESRSEKSTKWVTQIIHFISTTEISNFCCAL